MSRRRLLVAALIGMPRRRVAALAAAPFPNRLNRDDPRFPGNYRQSGAHGAFLIHAEAVLGQRAEQRAGNHRRNAVER